MKRFLLIVAALVVALVAWDLLRREPVTEPHGVVRGHNGILRKLAFSPDSRMLATSSVDGTVKLWSVPDLRLLKTLTHPAGVTSVAFSRNASLLVSGSYDGNVYVWQVRDGTLLKTLKAHKGTVWSVAIHHDVVASSGEDAIVRLWRISTDQKPRELKGHERNVWSVAFSPDGTQLVSGSFDRTAKVWNPATGALLHTLKGHEQAVVAVDVARASGPAFLIASGGDDSTVRLWQNGVLQRTLTGGQDHVYSVAFSSDGQWLASGGRERGALGTLWKQITGNHLRLRTAPTIRLWRTRDGKLARKFTFHTDDVGSLAVSPDGKWLASNSDDGRTALWPLNLPSETEPLAIGETFTIDSKILEETRRINVYIPPLYEPDQALPVLYMPDGGIAEDFLHVAGLMQVSVGNGTMRPFMLVGIENTQRRRDMTGPTENAEDRKIAPRVGGSSEFRAFIRDELIPRINERYKTTNERAIVGESLAGLFVVETFLLEPELFDTYIAFDPSLWWNDHKMLDAAPRIVQEKPRTKTVYLASSSDERGSGFAERMAGIANGHYEPMPEEKHATIYHPAALKAFRRVFAPETAATNR